MVRITTPGLSAWGTLTPARAARRVVSVPAAINSDVNIPGTRAGVQRTNAALSVALKAKDFRSGQNLAVHFPQTAQAGVHHHLRFHLAFVGAVLGGGHRADFQGRFQPL